MISVETLVQFIGHQRAPLKQMVPGSVEWARLELAGESTVAEFIDSLDHQGDGMKVDLHSIHLQDIQPHRNTTDTEANNTKTNSYITFTKACQCLIMS